jgi:hypothetical protein
VQKHVDLCPVDAQIFIQNVRIEGMGEISYVGPWHMANRTPNHTSTSKGAGVDRIKNLDLQGKGCRKSLFRYFEWQVT